MFQRKLPSSQESVAPQFKKCACPVGVRTESNHVGLARLVTGTRARSRAIGTDRATSHSTAVQPCCSDGLMSFPFAPRAILIISASVDTVCSTRLSVLWNVLVPIFGAMVHAILVTPREELRPTLRHDSVEHGQRKSNVTASP